MPHEMKFPALIVPGVFPDLTDWRAQYDTVRIGAFRAQRRRDVLEYITLSKNLPIGGKGKRVFGRVQKGLNELTGNPFELSYGLLQQLPGVPPFLLTLRSEKRPITCAEADLTLLGIFRAGFKAQVSSAELAFDIKRFTLQEIQRSPVTRTGRRWNNTTLYCGEPLSPWKLKIYDKQNGVSRVEFTFSRRFLARLRITKPAQLLALSAFPLTGLALFADCETSTLNRAASGSNVARGRILADWPKHRSMQMLQSLLADNPPLRKKVIRSSPIQDLISEMQARLFW